MEQFFRAIDHIEEHLFEDLSVAQIAQVACYSDYHFSRMFTALVGDSLMGYVRKRRLTVAAQRLLDEEGRLIDMALDCRFESQEAFTRAFKKMFSCTPGVFRKNPDPFPFHFRKPFDRNTLLHLKGGVTMEPKICEVEGFMAIGMSKQFNQETSATIPDLWDQLVPRIPSIPNKVGYRSFGICDSDASTASEGTFTYTAAVEVSSLDGVPDGMVGKSIAPQTYAVFTHHVDSNDISAGMKATLHYIWGTWLPRSNYVSADSPDFELYDERFNPETVTGEIDICVPIVEKV